MTGASAATGLTGTLITMNATNNKRGGYDRGNRNGASKNEKHGDRGRALSRADKQIDELNIQLQNATSKKEKRRIGKTIEHIKQNAYRKLNGEEHSKVNKR